jgi:uncharacterized membrane protein
MSRVSVRYNHDSGDIDLKWRVLIDGKENLASEVELLTPSTTTKDIIEGVGEKYHITCDPSIITWEGSRVILSDRIKSVSHKRHILKSFTYRVYSSCITSLIAAFVTGNLTLGISIGSADFFIKIITYYIHERIWYKIPFGIEKVKK